MLCNYRDTAGGIGRTCWAGWRNAVAGKLIRLCSLVTTALQTIPIKMFKEWNWSKHVGLILRMHRWSCSEQRWMDKYSTALEGLVDFFLPLWALAGIALESSTVLSSIETVKTSTMVITWLSSPHAMALPTQPFDFKSVKTACFVLSESNWSSQYQLFISPIVSW